MDIAHSLMSICFTVSLIQTGNIKETIKDGLFFQEVWPYVDTYRFSIMAWSEENEPIKLIIKFRHRE